MRLAGGQPFPIPVTLPVEPGPALRLDGDVALRSARDDPYEAPRHAEVTLDTVAREPEANARLILDYLVRNGFVQDKAS